MKTLSVREFARLSLDEDRADTLDFAKIGSEEFKCLAKLCETIPGFGSIAGLREIRLGYLIGIVALPSGRQLEILPKISAGDDAPAMRAILRKMLLGAFAKKQRPAGMADIDVFRHPLLEWVIQEFLGQLKKLVQAGLRSSYVRMEKKRPFLKGQLDVARQVRELPHKQHLFNIRLDAFSGDRPENRLLKSALLKIDRLATLGQARRLCANLLGYFETMPPSHNPKEDFRRWGTDRLMADYATIQPWCALVLGNNMPLALSGLKKGISFLFPMDKLFETYVTRKLQTAALPEMILKSQRKELPLCVHANANHFLLKPDIILEHSTEGRKLILDLKWKRLEDAGSIAESDVYQMHAYGQRYLKGHGDVALLYPKHREFPEIKEPFRFHGSNLALHILSFNLTEDRFGANPGFPGKSWFPDTLWPHA